MISFTIEISFFCGTAVCKLSCTLITARSVPRFSSAWPACNLDFFGRIARGAEAVADLFLGQRRQSLPQPFASARGMCLVTSSIVVRVAIVGNVDGRQEERAAVQHEVDEVGSRFLDECRVLRSPWARSWTARRPLPVLPNVAPTSVTTYRRSPPISSIELLTSFRSQLFNNDIITRKPFSSRVPRKGLSNQSQCRASSPLSVCVPGAPADRAVGRDKFLATVQLRHTRAL